MCSGVPDLCFQYFSAAPAPLRVTRHSSVSSNTSLKPRRGFGSNQPPTPAMS